VLGSKYQTKTQRLALLSQIQETTIQGEDHSYEEIKKLINKNMKERKEIRK